MLKNKYLSNMLYLRSDNEVTNIITLTYSVFIFKSPTTFNLNLLIH